MRKTLSWWAQFLGMLALPFLLVPGMWEAASLVPGTVKVEHWRAASSFAFLATTIPVVVLLVRSRLHWVARGALALFSLAVLLFAAFTMQIRSKCGHEPVLIGAKSNSEMVAKCE